jgi:hypothetical protein
MLLNQSEPGSAEPTRPWPAGRIERSAIKRLIPHADDARLRSDADIDELANSLRQWGSTIPGATPGFRSVVRRAHRTA